MSFRALLNEEVKIYYQGNFTGIPPGFSDQPLRSQSFQAITL